MEKFGSVEIEPNPELKFKAIQGTIELGDELSIELSDRLDELRKKTLSSLHDTASVMIQLGKREVVDPIFKYINEVETDRSLLIPIPDGFSEADWDEVDCRVDAGDKSIYHDSSSIRLYNASGLMICIGFGPDIESSDYSYGRRFEFCYAFIANYKNPGCQEIKILVSQDDDAGDNLVKLLKQSTANTI